MQKILEKKFFLKFSGKILFIYYKIRRNKLVKNKIDPETRFGQNGDFFFVNFLLRSLFEGNLLEILLLKLTKKIFII